MTLQARLKPVDGRQFRLQRITLSQLDGMRFELGFWYSVTDDQAEILRRVDQNGTVHPSAEDVQLEAFEIYTREEALELAQTETRNALLSTPETRHLVDPPKRDDPGDGPKQVAPPRRVGVRKG